MARTPEEMESAFKELEDRQAKFEKESKLQIDMAERNAKQFKEMAEKNADELRTFKLESEKKDKEFREKVEKQKADEILAYVDGLIKQFKLLPKHKDMIVKFMTTLSSESVVLEFSDSDGKKIIHNQVSLFKEIFSKVESDPKPKMLGKEHSFSSNENKSIALPHSKGRENPESADFVEVQDKGNVTKSYPTAGADFHLKVIEFQETARSSGRTVSYEDAMIEVSKQDREDTRIPQ